MFAVIVTIEFYPKATNVVKEAGVRYIFVTAQVALRNVKTPKKAGNDPPK